MSRTFGSAKFYGAAGAAGLFLAVALGAFAAHSLRGRMDKEMLEVFETGVRYQVYHSIALLVVAGLADRGGLFRWAGLFYVLGIILFSGSLYSIAFGAPDSLGFITPIGGLSFLIGHASLLVAFLKHSKV
ncbi:MAG TPA: DUF423 domain-containing protein [Candidatus Kryptonia bacterium]